MKKFELIIEIENLKSEIQAAYDIIKEKDKQIEVYLETLENGNILFNKLWMENVKISGDVAKLNSEIAYLNHKIEHLSKKSTRKNVRTKK